MQIGDIVELDVKWLPANGMIGIVKDVDRWSDPLVVVMVPSTMDYVMGEEITIGRRAWRKVGRIDQ